VRNREEGEGGLTATDDEGEHERRVRVHLDGLSINFDLAPRHSLVRTSSRIGAIKFLSSVDVHRVVCSVALCIRSRQSGSREWRGGTNEEHAVGDLVLADSSAEDDHACLFTLDGHVVQSSDVGHDVDDERRLHFV
jgi:hypothetical protein